MKAVQQWGIPRASLAEQKRAGEACKLLLQLLPVPEKSCDLVIAPEIFLDFIRSLLNAYSYAHSYAISRCLIYFPGLTPGLSAPFPKLAETKVTDWSICKAGVVFARLSSKLII